MKKMLKIYKEKSNRNFKNIKIMILKLTIKKKWFDMILSGEKKEEYRNVSKFYESRLVNNGIYRNYHAVQFFNGGYFSEKLPNFTIKLEKIKIGVGKKEWGAIDSEIYFILQLGKILSKSNCY